MIPARRSPLFWKFFAPTMKWWMLRSFKKLTVYNDIEIKPNHSVLLFCNHFSWWDGFLGAYLAEYYLKKKYYIMMQEDHLEQRMILNYLGGFSINRQSREMIKSLQYMANLLSNPENAVAMFPQGALESNHADTIKVEPGIGRIIKNIKGDCQIVYSAVLVDYFESLKPTAYYHLLDCGTNHNFNLEELTKKVNDFHKQALQNQINVSH